MKYYIIILMLIYLHIGILAQNNIHGTITDPAKQALVGATVYLPELNKGTIADESGKYELNNLPDGKIKIQYSYIGYSNEIKTFYLSGSSIHQDIQLKQTPIESEEIVITGGFNASQHENAVKIEMLKLKPGQIKSTPNISEVLTKIAGVDMISKGSGIAKPVIRGLSMNDILVLNHGVRMENYQYSSHHPIGIDEFGVKDVEIVKGPASLQYGSDAIGGVINFIKENPAPVGTVMGDYNLQLFSNTLGMTNNFGVKGSSGKLFGSLRAGHKTNADFLEGGGAFVPNTRFNLYSIKSNIGYSGELGTIKLFYDYGQQKLGLTEDEAVEAITSRGRTCEIFYQQFNTHVLSAQNKLYLGAMKLDINAAVQNTELIHFGEANSYELQMALTTISYETKIYLPSGEQSEYIFGLQGFNQINSNLNNRETILLPDAQTNNYSVFGMIQHSLGKKVKLQTGARYDIISLKSDPAGNINDSTYRQALDKTYNSLSGSLGMTYELAEDLMLRANIAAAYRTPKLAELTSNGPHEARYEIGDASLSPQNSLEGDMSMHYHKDNITLDLAVFYNHINDYIFIAPTGDTSHTGLNIYKYRQGNSFLYGGEAGIHFHPQSMQWLHISSTFSSVLGKQAGGDYLPFIPARKLNFDVRVTKKNIAFFNQPFAALATSTAFSQNMPAPDEISTAGYTLIDLSLGGSIKLGPQEMNLVFSINNLLDTRYVDHLSTLREINRYNPGRNITFTLHLPFMLAANEQKKH